MTTLLCKIMCIVHHSGNSTDVKQLYLTVLLILPLLGDTILALHNESEQVTTLILMEFK